MFIYHFLLHITHNIFLTTKNYILWRASLGGEFELVKKILSTKKANPNWANPQVYVSNQYYSFDVINGQ